MEAKMPHTIRPSLLQEKIEKANNEREEKGKKMRGKRHKLTLTPATSHSKIPSR